MNTIVDLNKLDEIRTNDEVIAAVEETFNAALPVSREFRLKTRIKLKEIAKKLGCYDETVQLISQYGRDFKEIDCRQEILQMCECDRRGNPLNITENYKIIMENDPYYAGVRRNQMSLRPETTDDSGELRAWTDTDDGNSRSYIEKEYGMYAVRKHDDALAALFNAREYHPIKDVIEGLKWDGETRIPFLLSKWMGVEDSEYTREVSRLIFAGGIQRLYHPGCKFEDMPVLIGGQGAGKSSFVRFLAIEDRFFTELSTIEGKEGMEAIEGAWIVEVSELLALTKTKEQEAVKAYLSRLVDKYRPAFGRRVIERPRTCTFIGTTNREQFITDKTGGRRFYPIYCKSTGYSLFDHERECREFIRQCWAEAYAKRDTPYMAAFANREVKPQMEEQQQAATEDDIRIGLIQSYLDRTSNDRVCIGQLWEEALGITIKPPERADQTQLGLIMQNVAGWEHCNYRFDFGRFGKQRHWKRTTWTQPKTATYDTPNDDVPY